MCFIVTFCIYLDCNKFFLCRFLEQCRFRRMGAGRYFFCANKGLLPPIITLAVKPKLISLLINMRKIRMLQIQRPYLQLSFVTFWVKFHRVELFEKARERSHKSLLWLTCTGIKRSRFEFFRVFQRLSNPS